jgi:hypothetical protein
MKMFAFDRSAIAVLAPLALLVAVVLLSSQESGSDAPQQVQARSEPGQVLDQTAGVAPRDQTVAANLPSR